MNLQREREQKDKKNRLIYSEREDRKTKRIDCFTAKERTERHKEQIDLQRKRGQKDKKNRLIYSEREDRKTKRID